jgi:Cys-tRNA synthase (O-phospho-L-seryl-tRNA:Cys-tRNA synthase)
MLKEAKKALRVTSSYYDSEIASLLMAGANDLAIAGVQLPGTVTFTISTGDTVTDMSTLTDDLAMRAVITYAQMRFGNPPNYQQLADAYDLQKVQLMHAAAYTDYGEEDDGDDEG